MKDETKQEINVIVQEALYSLKQTNGLRPEKEWEVENELYNIVYKAYVFGETKGEWRL